jgi:hypothetical protein
VILERDVTTALQVHRIIHSDGLKAPLTDVDTDLEYILKTSDYLMGLVNQRY